MGNIEYPRYSFEGIAAGAEAFLARLHPQASIPVPIEAIVDNLLKIDIVSMPGLHRAFDTDGFTTSDLSSIYVEEFVYNERPRRYRFTLAHEMGHIVLHSAFYRDMGWKSLADWKRLIRDVPEDQYSWMEWHANAFAGLILVPPRPLEAQLAVCEGVILKHLPQAKDQPEAYREFLDACLAKAFDVSTDVIARRLKKWSPGPG